MLVLTRKECEELQIGDSIRIKLIQVKGRQVRIGIEAPKDMVISRPQKEMAATDFKDSKDFNLAAQTPTQQELMPSPSVSTIKAIRVQARNSKKNPSIRV